MIPILYDANEQDFESEGIGRLTDIVSIEVTEELNGIYEVEFKYPIAGKHYEDIIEGRIIACTHDENGDIQPFDIYKREVPDLYGVVTFYARHVSGRLSNVIIRPFTGSSAANAVSKIKENSVNNNPFTFWTNKNVEKPYTLKVPTSCKSVLGGQAGSLLSVYGKGEYEFDKFTVKLWLNRGADNGVDIRYGKNLSQLRYEASAEDVYNAVAPYWVDMDETVFVYPPEILVTTPEASTRVDGEGNEYQLPLKAIVVDYSMDFEEQPTVEQLREKAKNRLNNNKTWELYESLDVDFVQLWETEEYKDFAPLQTVKLADTVHVYYEKAGIEAKMKVMKTVYNPILERYDLVELGRAKTSFAEYILSDLQESLENIPTTAFMSQAIAAATEMITGQRGGYKVDIFDADGKPYGTAYMDTPDVATARDVLMINLSGIGFSRNGINGPYRTAMTLDGHVVADFVDTGTLQGIEIIADEGTVGGWTIDNNQIYKDGQVKAGMSIDTNKPAFWAGSELSDASNAPFRVTHDGALYAGTGTFGGNLQAAGGTFAGNLQAAGGTFSGALSGATGTFSGDLQAAGGTFSGDLSAAGGTFSGDLSAAGGTFAGDLSAAGGTFSGNLQAAGGTFSGDLQAAGGTFAGDLDAAGGTFSGRLLAAGGSFMGTINATNGSQIGNWTFSDNSNLGLYNGDLFLRPSGRVFEVANGSPKVSVARITDDGDGYFNTLYSSGDIETQGSIDCDDDLTVGNDATITGKLYVNGLDILAELQRIENIRKNYHPGGGDDPTGGSIIVDINGTGDYTSFSRAVYENMYSGEDIYVKAGTYNMRAEYIELFGQSAVESMSDSSSMSGMNFGIVLDNRKVTFASGAVLNADWSQNTVDSSHRICALRIEENVTLKDVVMVATECFYAIHDDYGGTDAYTNTYDSCDITGVRLYNANCIGGGCAPNSTTIIDNCTFDNGYDLDGSITVRYHNTDYPNANPQIIVTDSTFNSELAFCWYGSQTTTMDVYVTGCTARRIYKKQESSAFNVDNVNLIKSGNAETAQ